MVLDLGSSAPGPPGEAGDVVRPRRSVRRAPTTSRRGPGTVLLYERVVQHVEQLIADGGLVPGDLLPSYTELADQAGVSLITVRRALDELERAGRVRRHQGLGTFVAGPRIVAEPARAGSLLGTLVKDGQPTGQLQTMVLEVGQGRPTADLGQALRVEPGSQVWRLRRLRLLDSQPAVLEINFIPAQLAPELDQLVGRLEGSLYDLLAAEYGLVDSYEEQYLEVIGPTQEETKLLQLPARAHVVRIRGLSTDGEGLPFDCFEQLYPASQFAFAIAGSTARQLLPAQGRRDWAVRVP
jgi:GntR family transcriptional regulator